MNVKPLRINKNDFTAWSILFLIVVVAIAFDSIKARRIKEQIE